MSISYLVLLLFVTAPSIHNGNTHAVFLERMLHDREQQQMNQILGLVERAVQCVHHSVEPLPLVCHASDR